MNKSLVPVSVAIMAGVAALCGGVAAAADQNGLVANTADRWSGFDVRLAGDRSRRRQL